MLIDPPQEPAEHAEATGPQLLERMLCDQIPLTHALGIRVGAYDGQSLVLHAPFERNTNHKCTVFGGSLYAVAVLSGWGLLYLALHDQGLKGHIVIQASTVAYELPGTSDFEARSHLPEDAVFERFLKLYRKRGKARLTLSSEIYSQGKRLFTFEGRYVAHT